MTQCQSPLQVNHADETWLWAITAKVNTWTQHTPDSTKEKKERKKRKKKDAKLSTCIFYFFCTFVLETFFNNFLSQQ